MAAGWSHMNTATVGRCVEALCEVVLADHAGGDARVVVGFDQRNHSREFADICCATLTRCGVEAVLLDEVVATPLLVSHPGHHTSSP